jgi:Raf kinase inhibitor-like YbhB/YbcL family protein
MTLKFAMKYTAVGVAVLLGISLVAFIVLRERGRADIADGQTVVPLDVKSSSFADGGLIPKRLTCRGGDLSPEIEFSSPPPGTTSVAIVMDDADSPFGFVHWLVYNIPSQVHAIAEGASSQKALPPGATEGLGSAETQRYAGPCPPGSKAHRYVIRIYALTAGAELAPDMTKQQLAAAVKGRVLAEGQWEGIFGGDGDIAESQSDPERR